MKKYFALIFVTVLAMAMFMTSCTKSEFGTLSLDDKSMTISAENAAPDDFFMTGSLVVEDGEKIVVKSDLEEGSIQLEFFLETGEQSSEEVPDFGDPKLTAVATGTDEQSFQLGSDGLTGSYMVQATVKEKATGTVQVDVVQGEAEKWINAASTDEAGEKAGVGLFLCDPQGTSLGPVLSADYRYMEGVAEAHYGIAAVEMFVRKGLSSIDEGDISFDNTEYAHEWTHDHDGVEVKCFGNRDGEATKSIWTAGDYSYCILAYGAGGDDDYGLSAEDLDIIMNDLQ